MAGRCSSSAAADELWAEFDEPDWDGKGDAPPRISRRVVMTTGSHQQQIFWYATGRGRVLGQLPAIRLIGDAAVGAAPFGNDASARRRAGFRERKLERRLRRSATPPTAGPRSARPIGSEPLFSQHVDTEAVGVRHRVRGVSWTGRRPRPREREPAAALRRCTSTGSADAHDRAAAAS